MSLKNAFRSVPLGFGGSDILQPNGTEVDIFAFLPVSTACRDRSLETLKLRTQRTIVFHTRFTHGDVVSNFQTLQNCHSQLQSVHCGLETVEASDIAPCELLLSELWVDSSFAARSIGRIPLPQIHAIALGKLNEHYCSRHAVNCSESLQSESKRGIWMKTLTLGDSA